MAPRLRSAAALAALGAAAAAAAAQPATGHRCFTKRRHQDAKNLSLVGPDGVTYSVPLRISTQPTTWDSQAVLSQIVGTLAQEELGIQVEYVPCQDEGSCYRAVSGCAQWLDGKCRNIKDYKTQFLHGQKRYEDPLPDIFFVSEVTPETFAAGPPTKHHTVNLGSTGYSWAPGLWVHPTAVVELWVQQKIDLLILRSFGLKVVGDRATVLVGGHVSTPSDVEGPAHGIQPEFNCSDTQAVKEAVRKFATWGYQCKGGWLLNKACVDTGNYRDNCIAVVDDSITYAKPRLYTALSKSSAPLAIAPVGYDRWAQLGAEEAASGDVPKHRVLFTWWNPDATFAPAAKSGPGLLNIYIESGPVLPYVPVKVGYRHALDAEPALAGLLANALLPADVAQSIMDLLAAARGTNVSSETAIRNATCEWLKQPGSKKLWSKWLEPIFPEEPPQPLLPGGVVPPVWTPPALPVLQAPPVWTPPALPTVQAPPVWTPPPPPTIQAPPVWTPPPPPVIQVPPPPVLPTMPVIEVATLPPPLPATLVVQASLVPKAAGNAAVDEERHRGRKQQRRDGEEEGPASEIVGYWGGGMGRRVGEVRGSEAKFRKGRTAVGSADGARSLTAWPLVGGFLGGAVLLASLGGALRRVRAPAPHHVLASDSME